MKSHFAFFLTLLLLVVSTSLWSQTTEPVAGIEPVTGAEEAEAEEEEKDEGWIRFIGLVDANYQYNHVDAPWQYDPSSSAINLSEIIFGIEWKPTELVFVHLDIGAAGSIESGISLSAGDIYGEVMFTKAFPVFLKGGYYELPNQQSRGEEFTANDSWVIDSTFMTNGAIELGVDYEIIRVGFGIFDSGSDTIHSNGDVKKDSNNVSDFYAYATARPVIGPFDLFLNLSYTSHVGDSGVGGGSDYDSKVPALVAELRADAFNTFAMVTMFQRLKDVEAFYTKYAYRGELAYNFEEITSLPITAGALFDYRKISDYVKGPQSQSEVRFGGLVGYEVGEGSAINFETMYATQGKQELTFTLQLIFEFPDEKLFYK